MLIKFLRLDHAKPFVIVLMPAIITAFTFGYCGLIIPTLLKTFLSAFLLITGGCIYNDFVDLKFDKQCPRSSLRPLASGRLGIWYALWCVPLLLGFLWSSYLFEQDMRLLFIIAFVLTLFYPFTKRFTAIPQVFLGLVNVSPLIVFKETTFGMLGGFSLYVMAIIWITVYDTLYAWQDIDHDRKLNLGNLGLLLKKRYLPLFIDIAHIVMGFCWAIHLKASKSLLVMILFIIQGVRIKSRFIKTQF